MYDNYAFWPCTTMALQEFKNNQIKHQQGNKIYSKKTVMLSFNIVSKSGGQIWMLTQEERLKKDYPL